MVFSLRVDLMMINQSLWIRKEGGKRQAVYLSVKAPVHLELAVKVRVRIYQALPLCIKYEVFPRNDLYVLQICVDA